MNNDLISREALKKAIRKTWLPLNKEWLIMTLDEIIDNAPTVKPCENCDLYFKAMTKEEQKGGIE